MKRILIPTMAVCAIGCNPEGDPAEGDPNNEPTNGTVTHQICRGENDTVTPRADADQSIDYTIIDSLFQLSIELDDEAQTNADPVKAGMAVGLVGVVGLGESLLPLRHMFDCSNLNYLLNQCNFTREGFDASDPDTVVSTIFNGQSYVTTVTEETLGEPPETVSIFEGNLGDLGNGMGTYFIDGIENSERVYSRDANGNESAEFTNVDGTEWNVEEDADCNGSLQYESPSSVSIEPVTLDLSWTFDGTEFSGLLEYRDPDEFAGVFALNF